MNSKSSLLNSNGACFTGQEKCIRNTHLFIPLHYLLIILIFINLI